uniref:Uncharacterized protein n=1 Tax=Arundo donax TaxID=35708 RepID=A0A0A9G5Q9_ARUDO
MASFLSSRGHGHSPSWSPSPPGCDNRLPPRLRSGTQRSFPEPTRPPTMPCWNNAKGQPPPRARHHGRHQQPPPAL